MNISRRTQLTAASLGLLAVLAWFSNTKLFRQDVQGTTDMANHVPDRLGDWQVVHEETATASEIRGLETTDIIKRTYVRGNDYMGLVVAYIAHSSRKSAHAQEACLRGAGALVGSIEDYQMTKSPVEAKFISIDMNNHREWVCYWYKIGKIHTAKYLRSSLLMFMGGLFGEKHEGAALVRLLTPGNQGESVDAVKARFEDFTQALVPELEKALP